MEAKISTPEVKSLSASRVKTLENCSWLYWAIYHLKLPSVQNDGAKKGEICHSVFECLLNARHRKHYDRIIKADSVMGSKPVERLIKFYIKRLKLPCEVFEQICNMIVVGLKTDFFTKGGKLVAPEYRFDLTNESPYYRMKGFMDKPYIVGNKIIIDDFKSSKKKFAGEDEESNLQALIYSLAATKIWPHLKPVVRFIFLQFPEDPLMTLEFTPDVLKGLEHYLADAQTKISNFTEKDARGHFAADSTPPPNEFKGKLLCGFARHPNQLKKNGEKMWHCPYRFPFTYFIVRKADATIAYSVFNKEDAVLKAGEKIERAVYDGCPRFRNALDGFPDTVVQDRGASKPKVTNVLDDFF